MRIALYQPDQPGNVGAILRLGACLGVGIDVIEPCGFPFSHRSLKRSGMDYVEAASVARHANMEAFRAQAPGRVVLLTTKGAVRIDEVRFEPGDTLLMGSESSGVPADVHDGADLRLTIPQAPGTRSLNIAVAAGIALAEALRQLNGYPRS